MTAADDRFEARLRALGDEADPPPAFVVEAARAAFSVRDLDAELAELVADSWAGDSVATRDEGADVRMLSFRAGGVVIEVDVEPAPVGGSRLHGLAQGVVGLAVVHPGGRVDVAVGDDGRFDVGPVPPGPVRIEATTADGGRIATTWVTT